MGRELVQCLLKMGSAPHISLYLCLILVNYRGGWKFEYTWICFSFVLVSVDSRCLELFIYEAEAGLFLFAKRKHYVSVYLSFGSFLDKVLMLVPMVEWWWSDIIFTIYWRCLCEETMRLFHQVTINNFQITGLGKLNRMTCLLSSVKPHFERGGGGLEYISSGCLCFRLESNISLSRVTSK